jgi:transmembrane sensor
MVPKRRIIMNKDILKRYFEGTSSRWEKKQVMEYFQGDDMRVFDEYIKDQEAAPTGNTNTPTPEYKENFYNELLDRITGIEQPAAKRRIFFMRPSFRIAATILMIIGAGAVFYLIKQHERPVTPAFVYETITNKTHILQSARLTDGTRIWLTPGSTLIYDTKRFGEQTRDITLKGEAYFDVAHNPQKPFRVNAGKTTTTVLGTAFNIEAYENEDNVRVLLVRGRVRVNAGKLQKNILPGHVLQFAAINNKMDVSKVDITGKQALFTSGKLIFESVPLNDVIKRLENIFDIKLIMANGKMLENKTVTGYYYRSNPDETLHRILYMHGLHLKKKGNKIYEITD